MERRAKILAWVYLVVGSVLFVAMAKGFFDTAGARFYGLKNLEPIPPPRRIQVLPKDRPLVERYVPPAEMVFPFY